MKKKSVLLIMLLVVVLVFCGCSNDVPDGFTEDEYDKCIKVLDTINSFLDADISAEDASEKLEVLSDQLKGSENVTVVLIGTYADSASINMVRYKITPNNQYMDAIIEIRDKINEALKQ